MSERGRPLTPARAGTWLIAALDAVALLALAGSGEVRPAVFAAVAAAALLAVTGRVRPGRGPLLLAFLALLLGAFAAWLQYRVHPIIVAAHLAPPLHALTWFADRAARTRSWRLGLGFTSLVLTSALTPELYLPLAIVTFVVLGAVALSCGFLEEEYRAHRIDPARQALPPRYVTRSAGLAVVIFLSAGLIFPLLPRVKSPGAGLARGLASTGYTEEVSLTEWKRYSDEAGGGAPVLRLFVPGESVSTDFYLGLLRMRVLDAFDGRRWVPGRAATRALAPADVPAAAADTVLLDGVREPLRSPALPVPYGTDAAFLTGRADGDRPARLHGGRQFFAPGSDYRRATFRLQFTPSRFYARRRPSPEDGTDPSHVDVPEYYRSAHMRRLGTEIFSDAKTPALKVAALRNWFGRHGFSAQLSDEETAQAESPALARLTPIERFLFVVRRGRCELFASSAALLLRAEGVPTRLIAGFRVSKPPMGGVLTVRQGDAHAWFEYYDPERGWEPVDLTPRSIEPSRVIERLRDAYDLLGAYWGRWVIGFDDGTEESSPGERLQSLLGRPEVDEFTTEVKNSLRENWPTLALALLAALVLGGTGILAVRALFPTLLSIRFRVREGPLALRNERLRLERTLERAGLRLPRDRSLPPWPAVRGELAARHGQDVARAFERWRMAYEARRFGPGEPLDLGTLVERRRELARALSAAAGTGRSRSA